jgi:hypothetical protein
VCCGGQVGQAPLQAVTLKAEHEAIAVHGRIGQPEFERLEVPARGGGAKTVQDYGHWPIIGFYHGTGYRQFPLKPAFWWVLAAGRIDLIEP